MDLQCVLLGDGAVGKTTLVRSFFGDGESRMDLKDPEGSRLSVMDAGAEYLGHANSQLLYKNASVFVLCYSVISPQSLDAVENKWLPAVREHAPDTPFLLVATKKDLHGDEAIQRRLDRMGLVVVDRARGKALAKRTGACEFLEVDTRDREECATVFAAAARLGKESASGAKDNKKRNAKCTVI